MLKKHFTFFFPTSSYPEEHHTLSILYIVDLDTS